MKHIFILLVSLLSYSAGFSQNYVAERKQLKAINKIREKWEDKANKGDLQSMLALAGLYHKGYYDGNRYIESYINRNSEEKWARAAAATGNADGYTALGFYFEQANFYDYNNDSAILYYGKAVSLGSIDAANKIGSLYENGYTHGRYREKVPPNVDAAFKYYNQAAVLGHPEFYYKIGHLYLLSSDMLKHITAIEWFKKAADSGYLPATDMLDDYVTAKDIPFQRAIAAKEAGKDTAAFKLAKIAAEINQEAAAMCMLGTCYYKGNGIEKNAKNALYWYEKAAATGSGEADYLLGSYYYDIGRYQESVRYYSKSASENYTPATYMLPLVKERWNDQDHNAAKEKEKIARMQEEARIASENNPNFGKTQSTEVIKVKWCWDCEGTGKIYNVYNGRKLSSWHTCGACGGKGYIK